eukprot:gnl/TRDRNA2_/TRDRNA2_176751_c0_seq1.p1 gnl/TRDRNA2_/TRDRNA2_176751_c0~~gnl/TRDRNA2_/TRDRNA2_176751_c0_seq1.p1  ORF type:complete len:430 (-),score=39.07 gnl/TRDRNA2_/TRDRNA2_176751_c0_seq1:102-1391(-)
MASPNAGGKKIILGICVMTVVALITLACLYKSKTDLQYEVQRAHAWEAPWQWHQETCTVLSAGVACVEKDTGSTCGGYPSGAYSMPDAQPFVFKTEAIATCPGTYWCAKEGEICKCVGKVTYASELFDGMEYSVDDADHEYVMNADGEVHCGHDEAGNPLRDPAPYMIKHCWCTPKQILALLSNKSYSSLSKAQCARESDADFEQVLQGQYGKAFARRLEIKKARSNPESRNAADAHQEDDADIGEDDDDNQEVQERVRRLTQHSSPRRRRTYEYFPWAFVELPPRDKDSFGNEGSFDAGDESKPASGPQFACAYPYGVPLASTDEYTSDGTYSGDVWTVEDIVKGWGKPSERPCWVRSVGSAAEHGQQCAVAMDAPGTLEEHRRSDLRWVGICFWINLALLIPCIGVDMFFGWQLYSARGGLSGIAAE